MKLHITLNSLGFDQYNQLFDWLSGYPYADLVELGQSFDLVDNPRYRDVEFIQHFNQQAVLRGYQTTVHLGPVVSKQINNCVVDLKRLLADAHRVQINRYSIDRPSVQSILKNANPDIKIILPACKINCYIDYFPDDQSVDWLYDSSHGRGLPINHFPRCDLMFRNNSLGYAGGIDENTIEFVAQQLIDLHKTTSKSIYMDLESGIRTNNQIDLNKISRLLTKFATIQSSDFLSNSQCS